MIGKAKTDTPDSLDTTFEPDYYVDEINLVMQERMPATATCKLKRGWAHLYDTNAADHNAIVGWHGNHPGLLLQVGYSGHGAMESPAVGSAWRSWWSPAGTGPSTAPPCAGAGSGRGTWSRRPSSSRGTAGQEKL